MLVVVLIVVGALVLGGIAARALWQISHSIEKGPEG